VLTIAKLRLHNFKCYGGEQVLELGPLAYAISAQHVGDPARSNWLGKSTLLEAVDYVLTGRIPRDCRRKSDWITHDEKIGEVEVVFSDGARVLRTMGRAKPERVWYFPADAASVGDAAMQDEVDKFIALALGLDVDDFWTSYFRQGEMSRLVRCEAAERMEYVTSWIRLEPIQACEDDAAAVLSELARRRDEETAKITAAQASIAECLRRVDCPDEATLERRIEEQEAIVRVAKANIERAIEASQGERERAGLVPAAKRYEEVVAAGKALYLMVGPPEQAIANGKALEGAMTTAEAKIREVGDRKALLVQDHNRKRALVRGEFDGVCPVVGAACPAREFVVGESARNLSTQRQVSEQLKNVEDEFALANGELGIARSGQLAFDRKRSELETLREEARRLKPSFDRYKALAAAELVAGTAEDVGLLRRSYEELVSREQSLKAVREVIVDAKNRCAAASDQAAEFDKGARTAAAATAIFGPNGAQRQIAEEMLVEIEADANEDLARAGIPLSVNFVWSREGQELAASCGECGQGFPATRKVKECTRCGAPRGPKLINRLEFDVSNRSGAADDLAAAFTQFAASAWLRADRESRWATVMIDEPLGQLDEANRKTFSAHLPGLLSRAGFAQALVIAHHSNVLDALPGRILIESDGRRSTVKVA
jgi:DNA repair exonuclease SbcCD ATPase subunit